MQYRDLDIQTRKDLLTQESKRGVWKKCTVELDPAFWRKIQDTARDADCSASELVRAIVAKWLEDMEER